MAEVAALANLAGILCCGLKLSISLYAFGTTLGTAGHEIKRLGTDITLFCSVLKQVQSTLVQVKAFQVSTHAIETTQEILAQSSDIFDELFSIFAKLQKDENLPVDFLTRVRWTFKRTKVLLLRESLQSCTAMLHLMLTTMSFAQRIATKGTAFDDEDEDEKERALTHSLCLAQKCTSERLEELEREYLAEESHRSDSALTMLATEQEDYRPYSPEELDDAVSGNEQATSDTTPDTMTVESGFRASRTTALLLGNILKQKDYLKNNNRFDWASVVSQQQSVLESDQLLRTWTNQWDPLSWDDNSVDSDTVLPSDSVSRYHTRSHSENTIQNNTTFLERGSLETSPTNNKRPQLVSSYSVDAADRSRKKVVKLTGEEYHRITPDWLWCTEADSTSTGHYRVLLPPLEPLECSDASKPPKRSRQPRWMSYRIYLSRSRSGNAEIQERLRSAGLL